MKVQMPGTKPNRLRGSRLKYQSEKANSSTNSSPSKSGFLWKKSNKTKSSKSSKSKGNESTTAKTSGKTATSPEVEQLAWATRESQQAEQERMRRLREQEEADLELAIALSKAEMQSEA